MASVRSHPLQCNCAQYFSWRSAPPAPALPLRLIRTANVLTTINIGLQALLQEALGVRTHTRTRTPFHANTLTPARCLNAGAVRMASIIGKYGRRDHDALCQLLVIHAR